MAGPQCHQQQHGAHLPATQVHTRCLKQVSAFISKHVTESEVKFNDMLFKLIPAAAEAAAASPKQNAYVDYLIWIFPASNLFHFVIICLSYQTDLTTPCNDESTVSVL